jgi:hypothetical protein
VFVKPAGGWANQTEQAKLTASDGTANILFGASVAVSGDTVVAGAPAPVLFGHPQGVPPGAAYLFGQSPHPTTTTVRCSPGTVAVGQPTSCTATVTDTATSDESPPSGTAGFTSTGPGGFIGSPCTLSPTSLGVASCSVNYTPGWSGTPTRSDTITGTYIADSTHQSSSGTTAVTVQPTSKNDCKKGGWRNYGFPNDVQDLRTSCHRHREASVEPASQG